MQIDNFRNERYRVFLASPYFLLDLKHEIEWNKKHVENLKKQADNPHLFHEQFTSAEIDDDRRRHFKEHVIDSIPFHERIMKEHIERLKTITKLVPKRKYTKIVKLSRKIKDIPEYFVYDKKEKKFFFVAQHLTEERKNWISFIKDKYKFCDVLVL